MGVYFSLIEIKSVGLQRQLLFGGFATDNCEVKGRDVEEDYKNLIKSKLGLEF